MFQHTIEVKAYGDFDMPQTQGFYTGETELDIVDINKAFVRATAPKLEQGFEIIAETDNSFTSRFIRSSKIIDVNIEFEGNSIRCQGGRIRFDPSRYAQFLTTIGFHKIKATTVIVNLD
jgi:hypothetical protein